MYFESLEKTIRNFRARAAAIGSFIKSNPSPVTPFTHAQIKEKGQGFFYKGREFVHHTDLAGHYSAFQTVTRRQKFWLAGIAFFAVLIFAVNWRASLFALIVVLTLFYFLDLVFNLVLIYRSFSIKPELSFSERKVAALLDADLPTYTIFCPLYKEHAVLPQFIAAMNLLDYPKEKLQILLLLEQDDTQTIAAAQDAKLPEWFEIVVVPHSQPKTKPKAMNYGLKVARGEFITIYDAEDKPEVDQLKKAVLAFQKLGPRVICVQGKLNFYNPNQNIVTKLFTAEYSLWFDLVLPGLQSLNVPIPLGGTSNHFRAADLRKLKGWDAFNVTEDCDLGMRLVKFGYRTAIIDSTTYEEANSNAFNWYRQRSRWIKGYIQTYLVHMRTPKELMRDIREPHLLTFQLVVGGKIVSMFVNPLLWLVTIIYFLFRSHVAHFIEPFFPDWILYFGVLALVFGNFLYLYYYMVGLAKRKQDGLIKYAFLVPLYWLGMSAAAWQALYEVIVKPHYWAKTVHGLHLVKDAGATIAKERAETLQQGAPLSVSLPVYTKATTSWRSEPLPVIEEKTTFLEESVALSTTPFADALLPSAPGIFTKVKNMFGSYAAGGTALVASMVAANFLNFLFNAILGRALTLEDFATVTLFNTVLNILAVVLSALGSAVTYKTAFLVGQQKASLSFRFLQTLRKYTWWVTGGLSVLWLVLVPVFAKFFNIQNTALIFSFTPVFMFGSIAALSSGYLRGHFRFAWLGFALILEALSKTVIAAVLVWTGLHAWASLAIPFSIIISFTATTLLVIKMQREDKQRGIGAGTQLSGMHSMEDSSPEKVKGFSAEQTAGSSAEKAEVFPAWYFAAAIVSGLASTIFLNVDVLLAKHYLSPSLAGEYSLLSLVGKMVYFMGSLLSPFVTSVVSKHEGAGTNPDRDFYRLLGGVSVVSFVSFGFMALFGSWLVPLLFGSRSSSIVPYLVPYCLAMSLFSVSGTIIGYHLVKKQYSFSLLMLVSALFLVVRIMISHQSIASFSSSMMQAGVVSFLLVFVWHIVRQNSTFVRRNLQDFFEAFVPTEYVSPKQVSGKNILIFNWRDTKHAYAGGAEVYVHELARRWVAGGNHVTLFCGNDGKTSRTETVDGVHVVRRGGFYFVYVWAFVYYMLQFRGKFDVIVDCQNGIPFFAPIYAKEKVFCLMHHVHQDVFRKYLSKPLAVVASFLENTAMPLVYRNTKFITISDSSKTEIGELGLGSAGMEIVHPGVDLQNLEPGVKHTSPLVVYLGRLKAYKSVDVLIQAFKSVAAQVPKALLIIAGDGEERENLKALAAKLGLAKRVIFTGKISEEEKVELLQKTWVFCNPSMMEGWGITTIEANACGVPVVASDVPGLRDSVRNPHTGYLVQYGNIEKFSEKITVLLTDKKLHAFMRKESIAWAQNFDWDKSAKKSLEILTSRNI